MISCMLDFTVKPRLTAQFGGTENSAVNRRERFIGVSFIGITWLLVEKKLRTIMLVSLINFKIGRIRDLMSIGSLHDAGNKI